MKGFFMQKKVQKDIYCFAQFSGRKAAVRDGAAKKIK